MSGWVGVDPGSRWTGIVGAPGPGEVRLHTVLDRDDYPNPGAYRRAVEATVQDVLMQMDLWAGQLAIENVTDPVGFRDGTRQFAKPTDLIGLGRLIGHLERAFPAAVLVRPNKHGHHAWRHYPSTLVTPGEARHAALRPNGEAGQHSTMRHCRSAYDVAMAAPHARRLADAQARPRGGT